MRGRQVKGRMTAVFIKVIVYIYIFMCIYFYSFVIIVVCLLFNQSCNSKKLQSGFLLLCSSY